MDERALAERIKDNLFPVCEAWMNPSDSGYLVEGECIVDLDGVEVPVFVKVSIDWGMRVTYIVDTLEEGVNEKIIDRAIEFVRNYVKRVVHEALEKY